MRTIHFLQPARRSICSICCALLALTLLAGAGFAQQIGLHTPQTSLPYYNEVLGGEGSDNLVGSDGVDRIAVRGPGGFPDSLVDGPGSADGKGDMMFTKDGDGLDVMVGGTEDAFDGDPNDKIIIVAKQSPNGHKVVLWYGTVQEYKRTRAMLRWLQDRVQKLIASSGGGAGPQQIQEYLARAILELRAFVPSGDPISFVQNFHLGPYESAEVPDSPGDLLLWLPFDHREGFPDVQTTDLKMTPAQYDGAVADVVRFADFALAYEQD